MDQLLDVLKISLNDLIVVDLLKLMEEYWVEEGNVN